MIGKIEKLNSDHITNSRDPYIDTEMKYTISSDNESENESDSDNEYDNCEKNKIYDDKKKNVNDINDNDKIIITPKNGRDYVTMDDFIDYVRGIYKSIEPLLFKNDNIEPRKLTQLDGISVDIYGFDFESCIDDIYKEDVINLFQLTAFFSGYIFDNNRFLIAEFLSVFKNTFKSKNTKIEGKYNFECKKGKREKSSSELKYEQDDIEKNRKEDMKMATNKHERDIIKNENRSPDKYGDYEYENCIYEEGFAKIMFYCTSYVFFNDIVGYKLNMYEIYLLEKNVNIFIFDKNPLIDKDNYIIKYSIITLASYLRYYDMESYKKWYWNKIKDNVKNMSKTTETIDEDDLKNLIYYTYWLDYIVIDEHLYKNDKKLIEISKANNIYKNIIIEILANSFHLYNNEKGKAVFVKDTGVKNKIKAVLSNNKNIALMLENKLKSKLAKCLDSNRYKMYWKNCVINRSGNKLYKTKTFNIEDFISMSTDVNIPETKNIAQSSGMKKLKLYFNQLFGRKLGEKVLEDMSCLLAGKNEDKVIRILQGSGNGSKSSFIKLIQKTLGEYSGELNSHELDSRSSSDISNSIASGINKNFVHASEVSKIKLNSDLIKRITGDDIFSGRMIYKTGINKRPRFCVFMSGNSVCKFDTYDDAIHRRLVIIPFDSTWLSEDKFNTMLEDKERDMSRKNILDKNFDSVLDEMIEPFAYLLFNNFTDYVKNNVVDRYKNTDVEKAIDEYWNENDTFMTAFKNCYVKSNDSDKFVLLDRVYEMVGKEYKFKNINFLKDKLSENKIVVEKIPIEEAEEDDELNDDHGNVSEDFYNTYGCSDGTVQVIRGYINNSKIDDYK